MEQKISSTGEPDRVRFLRLWLRHLAEVQSSDNPLVGFHVSVSPEATLKAAVRSLNEDCESEEIPVDLLMVSNINAIARGIIKGDIGLDDLFHDEELSLFLRKYERAYPTSKQVLVTEAICQDLMVGEYCMQHGLYKKIKSEEDFGPPRKVSPEFQARLDRTMIHIRCRFIGDIPKNMSLVAC